MADPPDSPDTGDERMGLDRASLTGAPRWVKVFGLVSLVVVVLFVVVMLVGSGEHGPGRHTPWGGSDIPRTHGGPPPGFEHDDQQP